MSCKCKYNLEHALQWCNDNYFSSGMLTLSPEELAYIVHKYHKTYANDEQALGKAKRQPAREGRSKRVER